MESGKVQAGPGLKGRDGERRRWLPGLALLLLAATLLGAAQPLAVARVEREGLPPYEEGAIRRYRLEGEGCGTLHAGELLDLRRPGEKTRLGRLKVTAVKDGYALAELAAPGDTYPLKGDVVVRMGQLRGLPSLPEAADPGVRVPEFREPGFMEAWRRMPRIHAERVAAAGRKEPIWFLRGDARLSPGALRKLEAWTRDWGKGGRWLLGCPARAGEDAALRQARIEALRGELKRLGVERLEVLPLPEEAEGRYDAVYVVREGE